MAFDLKDCNTSRYKNRADYGVRVARPGYDAYNCAQNQLVFNSGWPIIQITNVIDLNKVVETRYVWLKDYYNTNREWRTTEPSGITYGYGYETKNVSVGRNYVWLETRIDTGYDSDSTCWMRITYKKLYHGMGYPVVFYKSEDISDVPEYIILTSVDLTTDVDYPYTEGATKFFGSLKDYGIDSTSKFGSKVPGLRSDMFSKLVQAVKTQETSNWRWKIGDDVAPEAGGLIWSPLSKLEDYNKCLEPYEAIAYNGFNNPFGYADFSGMDRLVGFGDDAPYYRDDQTPVRAVSPGGIGGGSGSLFGDGVAFTNIGQSTYGSEYSSMVIMRSPMVSPEYEEIVV